MKIEAIIARIINGPKLVIDTSFNKCYYVECLIDIDFIITNHVFFFPSELEASQLTVGRCVYIESGVEYTN